MTDPLLLLDALTTLSTAIAAQPDVTSAVRVAVDTAVQLVPGTRWASVTRRTSHGFSTIASTGDVPATADRLQYQLHQGACVAAVAGYYAEVYSPDVATDTRWPAWGPRAAKFGVGSVLSICLITDTDDNNNAGLNLYADHPHAFDDASRYAANRLAAHAAVAIAAVIYRQQARQLRQAMPTNREVGVAMGVLMTTHKITRDQAFDLLRIASQDTNRKLRDLATEVADTGTLTPLPPPP